MYYAFQYENLTPSLWSCATHKTFSAATRLKIFFLLCFFRRLLPTELILDIISLSIHAPLSPARWAFVHNRTLAPPDHWPDFPRRLPARLHLLSLFAYFDPHRMEALDVDQPTAVLLQELWAYYASPYPSIANGIILHTLARWPYHSAEHSIRYQRFQFHPSSLPELADLNKDSFDNTHEDCALRTPHRRCR